MIKKIFIFIFLSITSLGFTIPYSSSESISKKKSGQFNEKIADSESVKPKIQVEVPSSSQQEQNETSPPSPALPEIPPLPSSHEITTSYESSFVRVLVSLIGLVVLVVATFWILKRLGQGRFGKLGSNRSINILERRALSPKSVLYLVEVENKRVLISESQFEVRPLTTLEPLEEIEK